MKKKEGASAGQGLGDLLPQVALDWERDGERGWSVRCRGRRASGWPSARRGGAGWPAPGGGRDERRRAGKRRATAPCRSRRRPAGTGPACPAAARQEGEGEDRADLGHRDHEGDQGDHGGERWRPAGPGESGARAGRGRLHLVPEQRRAGNVPRPAERPEREGERRQQPVEGSEARGRRGGRGRARGGTGRLSFSAQAAAQVQRP